MIHPATNPAAPPVHRGLTGQPMPSIAVASTDGRQVVLGRGTGRTVLYVYPLMSRPGLAQPDGWDAIPGARGCTSETCGFRDHHAELVQAGASEVFGLSSQPLDDQAAAVTRLRLPFVLLSDPALTLADALTLPTFSAPGHPRLYTRLTLILRAGRIEHVFHPVPAPEEHAREVIAWLTEHSGPA